MRWTISTVLIFLLNAVHIQNNIVEPSESFKNSTYHINRGTLEDYDSVDLEVVTEKSFTSAVTACTNCDRPPLVLLPVFIKIYRYPRNLTKKSG